MLKSFAGSVIIANHEKQLLKRFLSITIIDRPRLALIKLKKFENQDK